MTKKKIDTIDSSKNIVNNKNKKSTSSKKVDNNKKLEHTTRIRVDSKRINDLDSLDTSFLEGRIAKKTRNNKKAKEMILNEKRQMIYHLNVLKKVFFSLSFLLIVVLSIIYCINHKNLFIKNSSKKEVVSAKTNNTSKFILDENYVFIGDFSLEKIDYDSFSVPTIIKVNREYQTEDILNHMKDFIYIYNPSFVYIGIGMNDIEREIEISKISSNIEKIIQSIKENRPLARIVIQTVYSINEEMKKDDFSHITIDKIIDLNKEIKKMANNEKIEIVDFYNILSFKDVLREKYTSDGVHLNDLGYSIINKKIKEVVDENEKKETKKDQN